jgi:hypothetical protein
MTMNSSGPVKRKNVRWKGDATECAYIDFELAPRSFKAALCALIVDQSHRGCCLVALSDERLVKSATLRVQLGPLDPLVAVLRWVAVVDADTVRIGCEFP